VDGSYLGNVKDFDLEKTYYLAGPMTGYDRYNYAAFSLVAAHLRLNAIKVESPHENEWPADHESMSVEALWQHMMEVTSKQLDRCDGMILMPGWPESRGVRAELEKALDRKLPIYFFTGSEIICMNRRIPLATE
jgi:hypothetical protein